MPARRWILAILVVLAVGLQAVPPWRAVVSGESGRDYATYHYAVQVAVEGRDPYSKRALGQAAKQEGTRSNVHPYFYPPPFLLGMLWAVPLSLAAGYRAFFWLNQAALLGLLYCFHQWFRVHPLGLAALALTFSPLADSAKMGQANLPVLLLAVLGLWRGRGGVLAAAAMAKMSPALYLAWWALRRRWRPVAAAGLGAVFLSVAALPLVDLPRQVKFYTEVLPGFSSGTYHGLTVPLTLPANHSIPDLYNQLWPGPTGYALSARAQRASSLTSLLLLAGWAWAVRRERDALGEACALGALTVLMLITPAYTYEHHLSMLILPLAALAGALQARRLSWHWWPILAVAYFVTAWPLRWLRDVQRVFPDAHWWLQESKFLGPVLLGLACLAAARRSPAGP